MITVNSISGGKTSAYLASQFPADYNIFQLVRLNTIDCLWKEGKDEPVRNLISDRIGMEFIGTAEDDEIIYTILDLEQYLGTEIKILTADYSFEEMIKQHNDRYLPSPLRRYCTTELKIEPTFNWWLNNFNEVVEMRIGYRANEMSRMKKMLKKCDENRLMPFEHVVGSKETKKGLQNIWETTFWQKPVFPLIEEVPTWKDSIEIFWKDKPIRFAAKNNCLICPHSELLWLKYQWEINPQKMEVAASFERNRKYTNDTLKANKDITYDKIREMKLTGKLTLSDFSECDSGVCGF
ncbi:hypothetical protein [Myroides marinus]|uniref:hypothetical protein n=1 Tax=Myroides marinus TaxID=703342 RepID=UPI002578D939|nr:hypothetical protein [Myroides marinus]MDM1378804.1 hypothetical protein [Myroides marinus]MDM1386075.1 hypothetical protein [Myroides marinus]MDM1393288.1 hypothetical protein [Myroides marinus]